MNSLLVAEVLGVILIALVVGWSLILYAWRRKGLTESELRERQRRVRRFAARVDFVLLAIAIVLWRLLAFGIIGNGPGVYLLPIAAIVCLVGAIAVRGLWYVTQYPWLDSVSYRVSLQSLIVAVVAAVTAFDLKDLPGPNLVFSLLVFAFLSATVALGSFILERLLPDADRVSPEGRFTDPQPTSDSTQLARIVPQESVFVPFQLPEYARIPFGQYLLYFGQFLRDVGVDVETTLTEEGGSLLFSVTPTQKTEALQDIRVVLDLYVHLRDQPIDDTATQSIEAKRLEATILRLRADLKLAEAELQAQKTTIKYQQLMLDVKSDLKEAKPKPEDPEYLIPGLIALGTLEARGVKVNLGELLRRVKEFLAVKKGNSGLATTGADSGEPQA